ncbi:SIMPL domain-containing protein [Aeromicrobium chenweiae]|uniref:SIMPL domain-containing protein n=1 Tax=Aeromicrobium chenweiae TaxID=2079793 RepID=A0A2S0WR72_9ACTN|nr:SIMPL domain-containing protein [Aeromicrobium chenweiae]AWB93863.1 SIMPL domain-containing protein [Aeromicrobium chenweiae]TGN30908.1 SIMPL domain-containing protein [Aeromicrobium chenweiae]
MSLEITVRGSAEQSHPAERATVSLAAAVEGGDKQAVVAEAIAIQEPLSAQLRELTDLRAVRTWSSDQVHVLSHRPWAADGQRSEPVHVARLRVRAEFVDFERLSSLLDDWSGVDGVEIAGIAWDVTAANRRAYEAEARTAAVEDAVTKAQAYADAVGRGRVVAVQVADPGMLTGPGASAGDVQLLQASAKVAGDDGPVLDLAPEEILVRVEVDARFRAD